jgi:hypothetical protein
VGQRWLHLGLRPENYIDIMKDVTEASRPQQGGNGYGIA